MYIYKKYIPCTNHSTNLHGSEKPQGEENQSVLEATSRGFWWVDGC